MGGGGKLFSCFVLRRGTKGLWPISTQNLFPSIQITFHMGRPCIAICGCLRIVNEMGEVPSLAQSDLPYRQMDKVHLQYQQVVN